MPPSAGYQGLVEYTSRMWAEYVNQFGQGDTYGFSVPEGSIDRLSMMGAVYGSREPYVLDLHIYDNPYNSYTAACDYLSSNNHNQGWVIGETYNNLASQASAFQSAQAYCSGKNTLFFLLQWPVSPGPITTPPTIAFNNYLAAGY